MRNPLIAIKNAHNYVHLFATQNMEIFDKLTRKKHYENFRNLPWNKLGVFTKVDIIKSKQKRIKAQRAKDEV